MIDDDDGLLHIDSWPCPPHVRGMSHEFDNGRTVFACERCPNPAMCADNCECECDLERGD